MPAGLLPLFPLQVVVFPRTRLPLHIFEERYKEMIGEALRHHSEFGIVLAREDGIVNTGCTVVVDKVLRRYSDGRMDIVASGRRRFEILMLNEEKDYLRGEVEYFDDEESGPVPPDVRRRALEQHQELAAVVEAQPFREPNLSDAQVSFQIAQGIQDLDFLNLLLCTRSEAERLREYNQFVSGYITQQRHVQRVKALAPRNGFGGKLPDS